MYPHLRLDGNGPIILLGRGAASQHPVKDRGRLIGQSLGGILSQAGLMTGAYFYDPEVRPGPGRRLRNWLLG